MTSTSRSRRWRSAGLLAPSLRRTFADLLPYCFPVGEMDEWGDDDGHVTVRFRARDEDVARVERLLETAFERSTTLPAPSAPPLAEVGDQRVPDGGSPAAVISVGPGLVVGSPTIARLMGAADNLAARLAADLGAVELAVPHLVSWSTIERAGYHRTFPQHLTACEVVARDLDAVDRFGASDDTARRGLLEPAPVCLAPAVCLHVFASLAEQAPEIAKPVLVTVRGACGRFEAHIDASTTRLWSFTMREIVFVGDSQGAGAFRDTMLERLSRLLGSLGLPGRLVAANDPFFTAARADLGTLQSRFDLKHEVLARMPDGTDVAVSSVNLHSQHFGTGFGIRLPGGGPASSACVGFGLERWAQWLHAYIGPDPQHWPDELTSGGVR